MLTIRAEQMEVFSTYMLQQFELRMARHLRNTFPRETAPLSDERLDAFVRQGIDKANGYGVTTEYDIRRFLELVTTYGIEIERDRQLRWAVEILQEPGLDGTAKMDRIDAYEEISFRPERRP